MPRPTRSPQKTGTAGRLQLALAVLSVTLLVAAAGCYLYRGATVVAVTIWPPWFWALPGVGLALLSGSRAAGRRTALVLVGWLAAMALLCEEPRALLTCGRDWPDSGWRAARERGDAIRVVSLNCAGGSVEAAAEALRYDPDLVLLQESPSAPELRELLAHHAAYGLVWGFDASVIARGSVTPRRVARADRAFVTAAEVKLSGRRLVVLDTRLVLPYLGTDLWHAAGWRNAREAHGARCEQLSALARYADAVPADVPLIVGGDFNTPPGDSLFRLLPPRLHDSFRAAGFGLGNTIINAAPLSRIDQLWVDEHLVPRAVVARKTQHSDHRIVICDVVFRSR